MNQTRFLRHPASPSGDYVELATAGLLWLRASSIVTSCAAHASDVAEGGSNNFPFCFRVAENRNHSHLWVVVAVSPHAVSDFRVERLDTGLH